MPTTRYYPKVASGTLRLAVPQIARFLINDHATYTGPGWKIIEAYSSAAALNKYRTPTGGDESNMDNAAFSAGGDFGWQTGVVTDTDWIVLESLAGVCGNKFEICIRLTSATNVDFILFPLDNFVTGSGTTPPTYPAVKIGNGAGVAAFTGFAGAANYSVIADECMVVCLADDATTPYWIYIGEVDSPRAGGTPADDRPFVISDTPNDLCPVISNSPFNRASPVDDATTCILGFWALTCLSIGTVHGFGLDTNLLGMWTVLPIAVYFHDVSHRHVAGYLRNVGSVSAEIGTSGTLNSLAWMHRASAASTGLAFAWDGVTAY